MTAAIVATAGIVVVALAARLVAAATGRRRAQRAAGGLAAWSDPSVRSLPEELDLARLGLAVPGRGELLGVVFTHPACRSCGPLTRRVAGIEGLTTAVVDVSDDPVTVRAAGVESVPTLVLVDDGGEVVRSWIGTPLAGTVEETVRRRLDA